MRVYLSRRSPRTSERSAPARSINPLRDLRSAIGNRAVARMVTAPSAGVETSGVESYLNREGPGRPLPQSVRTFFEPRFGQDLGHVRVHTGNQAAAAARSVNAAAFTVGNDVVFGAGSYAPETSNGQRLLAHELAHTIQQSQNPSLRRTIQRGTLAQFRTDLEAIGPDHATVIATLFTHPRFVPLADFLRNCPAGTIDFQVRRSTQVIGGRTVDLFGGFTTTGLGAGVMEVNPVHPAHAANPIEVVDTIVHEFIHAAIGLRSVCESSANTYPLAATVHDVFSDPELAPYIAVVGTGLNATERSVVAAQSRAGVTTQSGGNLLEYFDRNYGPSASRPQTHYIDLGRGGLELVTSIMADIRSAHPTIGRETVSVDNVELFQAEGLLATRPWWNSRQRAFSMSLHKNRVARKRNIDPATYTDREYDISAIQVVEFADRKTFDPNTSGGWGPVGGVWECHKRSRFTGQELHTYVTGVPGTPPGGAVGYRIIQHT